MLDINKDGKGIWFVIHTLALNTKDKKQCFEWMINTLADNFGCEICKPHIKKFILDHPLKNYNEDYFKWTWELHNDVNRRLNKPTLPLEEALNIYKNMVCKNCDKQILIPITSNTSFNTSFNIISR